MALEKMTIGKYLKRFRETFNLTQKQVSERIGIHPQLYLKYEKDESYPSVLVVMNIAVAFSVSADYLLGLSDKPKPSSSDEDLAEAVIAYRKAVKTFDKFLETKGID